MASRIAGQQSFISREERKKTVTRKSALDEKKQFEHKFYLGKPKIVNRALFAGK